MATATHAANWANAEALAGLNGMSKKDARSHLKKNPTALSDAQASVSVVTTEKSGAVAPKAKVAKVAKVFSAQEAEAAVVEKYEGVQIVAGSLTVHTEGTHKNKRTVEFVCPTSGCETTRTVATSDLFQTTHCPVCTRINRLERRRKRYEAAKVAKAK